MADKILTLTVPEAEVTRFIEGFLTRYPNTECYEEGNLKCPDAEWILKKIKQIIKYEVRKGLEMKASREVVETDNIIT